MLAAVPNNKVLVTKADSAVPAVGPSGAARSPVDVVDANFIQVNSTVIPDQTKTPGYGFRAWKYATIKVSWSSGESSDTNQNELSDVCLDSGCGVTLIDRAYLLKVLPKASISKMPISIPVRGIGNKILRTDEYTLIKMAINGLIDDKAAQAIITIEAHIVDDLKANALIGSDTLKPQGMCLDFEKETVTIGTCKGLTAPIDIHARQSPHAKRTIKSKSAIMVPPRTTIQVPVAYRGDIPGDRDFLFEPECSQDFGADGGVFAHIVDSSLSFVQVYNASNVPVRLPRKARLGSLVEFEQDGAYMVSSDQAHLAAGNTSTWKSRLTKGFIAFAAGLSTLSQPSVVNKDLVSPLQPFTSSPSVAVNPTMEHVMHNGITVYGTPGVASQIAAVANEFPEIWTDQGSTVRMPESDWMPIPLKPNAADIIKPARAYPVSQKDKQLIDETFDKLHAQGKMSWTEQPTPFSFPVFVVWRMVNGEKKGRVVVDIRALNQLTVNDTHPLPLQSEVIGAVSGFPYISTMDGVGYFHQFNVQYKDRHKLTVVSHRGQEQYNVAMMGYKGSPPYVQRQTDKLLRPYKGFARAYIDDIIAFSRTLLEHLSHLRTLFSLYRKHRISLNPKKTFLGYPSITLLGQRVDSLGMSTSEEKLAAIRSLRFPTSLRDLETFLGLTGWLRSSVERYAQRAQPLQLRKTDLTAGMSSAKGFARRKLSAKSFYEPTKAEQDSFNDLKRAFESPRFLIHFNEDRKLFIDLDTSKAWGFTAMIYHVKGDSDQYKSRTDVQPIMFLSKMLSSAENNYWPTELEVAGVVWVVRKVRHLIESSRKPPTIIYTDHSAAVPISRQTTMSSSSTDKLNLRLVRASQYLSQFNLLVKYKAGKANIVPDALSRLQGAPPSTSDSSVSTLDALCADAFVELGLREASMNSVKSSAAYHITLVEMSQSFKDRLMLAYKEDKQWNKVLVVLRSQEIRNT